jgi:hypothetical protein
VLPLAGGSYGIPDGLGAGLRKWPARLASFFISRPETKHSDKALIPDSAGVNYQVQHASRHEELAMTKPVKPSKVRIGLEAAIASFAGALGVLTVFWHDWIEGLTGWDPDHHNGAFEWLIVVVLLVVAAVAGAVARRDWHLRAASGASS